MKRTVLNLIVLIAALATICSLPYAPIFKQFRNRAAAERHIPVLEPLVHKDGRFPGIELKTITARGGCLIVSGVVLSDEELKELKQIVDSSKPPVEVMYLVMVDPNLLAKLKKRVP